MSQTVREFLREHFAGSIWGNNPNDKELYSFLCSNLDPVWTGAHDEHRWYTLIETVVSINGKYILFQDCHVKSEINSWDDCVSGTTMIDNARFATPKVVTKTIYEAIEDTQ